MKNEECRFFRILIRSILWKYFFSLAGKLKLFLRLQLKLKNTKVRTVSNKLPYLKIFNTKSC